MHISNSLFGTFYVDRGGEIILLIFLILDRDREIILFIYF